MSDDKFVTIWACDDCTLSMDGALEDTPDREPWSLVDGDLWHPAANWDAEATDDDQRGIEDFSTRPCGACGSIHVGEPIDWSEPLDTGERRHGIRHAVCPAGPAPRPTCPDCFMEIALSGQCAC